MLDLGFTSWSCVLVLTVFTCARIKLDFHTPVYLININTQVPDSGILFVQAPVRFFFLLIIQIPKQLRLLLQSEHFQMPTPHSRDPLHFKQRGDEDLEVKIQTLEEHFNASVVLFSYFLLCLHPKGLKK